MRTGSDGSTTMVELASGVALWYHGGPPRLPIRWVVIRYLEERRGPYALLCTDTEAEPLRILQWYLLRWQVEVTFEELRAHLGMETQRQWSERSHRPNHPRALWPVQRGDAGSGYPDRTAWRHGAAHCGVV